MSDNQWERQHGSSERLGATWIADQQAWNFALYSKYATQVTLNCYTDDVDVPCFRYTFDPYLNKTGRIWHARIEASAMKGAKYYGYKVDGPKPGPGFGYEWHNFDKDKVLLDPYAQAVFFPPNFSRAAACRSGSNDGKAPLGRLDAVGDTFDWADDKPQRHGQSLVIYELHVGHFTRNPNSGLPPGVRGGTFRGVIEKIPHLKELGVTAVELMPVFQFDPQEGSVWGYMTLNFFAPHHAYSTSPEASSQKNEFREMVKALHAAGMEVLLDVVYNHTTEGDQNGPLYSFKGIDSSSYYMIEQDNLSAPYSNWTGCGNTILASNAAVRRLVLDSMRYWVEEMHVDGFRFDIAAVLAVDMDGNRRRFDEDAPLFDEIAADPVLNGVRLIAEQWSMENDKFPGRVWHQWNGRYRDCLRRFLKGDSGQIGTLMSCIYGSCDLFSDSEPYSMHPYQSVNYTASHDGMRMGDLVSFTQPTDGDAYPQYGWDCGYHGVIGAPPEVVELRKRQIKNFCTLLMLSNGTPMILMGDEFMQGQQGYRNPYNIDSLVTWIDWDLKQTNDDIFQFFKRMIAFRKEHPSFCRSTFWREAVSWYSTEGPSDLSDHCQSLAFFLDGRSVGDDDFYVMINAYWDSLAFRLHKGEPNQWVRVVDTSLASPNDIIATGGPPMGSDHYQVGGRAVVVLMRPNFNAPAR
jgi:glycogen operon protein